MVYNYAMISSIPSIHGTPVQPPRRFLWSVAALLQGLSLFLLAGCDQVRQAPVVNTVAKTEPTATPTPAPPGPDQVAAAFFQAWQERRYGDMYDLLASPARATIDRNAFIARYQKIHEGIGATRLAIQAEPTMVNPSPGPAIQTNPGAAAPSPVAGASSGQTARVPYRVTRQVAILGDLDEANELPLIREPDAWRVDWNPGLIFKGLTDSSTVRFAIDTPPRGRILDRQGRPLAENGKIVSIGVAPGRIQDEGAVLQALSDALKLSPEVIKRRYANGQPDWFMPIADRPETERPTLRQALGSIPGISLGTKTDRVYPLGAAAAHLVGYNTAVTADELKRLADQGYEETDRLGRTGIEAWGEQHLAGKKGAKLTIVDKDGQVLRSIAERPAQPGADVQLTLDADIQAEAFKILGDKPGSLVVMDPRDNSVLAIASSPSFDPNQFILGLTDADWEQLNGPSRPLLFRATQQAYPTGSVFKVITMAAGLEKGGFTAANRFDCGLEWRGLPGVTLRNWEPQGVLSLVESLAASCNPTFYTIGLKLNEIDPNILPDYARAFGLGQPTGAEGLAEIAGTVPDPTWKQQQVGEPWYAGDNVNLAIGQGYLQATPLQMANAYAALANGGALRTPLLIRAIQRPGQSEQVGYLAKEVRALPLSAQNRAPIIAGMSQAASTPRGTAHYAFRDEKVPTAAKTGSAENENPDAHAWFAGFMTPDQPAALTIVMIEGGRQGSTVAAPLGRQILDFVYPRLR